MGPKEFEAAGLYDPASPTAAERLAFLEWLVAQGASLEQMVAASRGDGLGALAVDLQLRPGPRVTARDVAARHGLAVDDVMALSLAIGLPPRDPDDPVYREDEAVTFEAYRTACALFGETATRRFVRVVGSSLARIAEAAVSLFQVQVAGPMRAAGGTDFDVAKVNARAIGSLSQVQRMLQALFTGHMEAAIRRLGGAQSRRAVGTATMAVGFVDLVGFTTLASRISPTELADVIERFEEIAYDVATAHGGRVVKLIGDEVMFVTHDPAAACDIALTLFDRFADDVAVTPRGGIAMGEVLARGGDYHGPVVNLASRIAELAVPNELLVTMDVATAVTQSPIRSDPAGKRLLKGFEAPVALASVTRATPARER